MFWFSLILEYLYCTQKIAFLWWENMLDSVCSKISITISLLLGKICYYGLQQLIMYSQADKQLELVILPQPLLSLSLSLTW